MGRQGFAGQAVVHCTGTGRCSEHKPYRGAVVLPRVPGEVWGHPVLPDWEHPGQKAMPSFWCAARPGTVTALASHSLVCPGITHLPCAPKSVLPRHCPQLSCRQPVSEEKCEYIPVCCCQAETSSAGAFPRPSPGSDGAVGRELEFLTELSVLFFLTAKKNNKRNTPSLLSCRKGHVPSTELRVLCFTPSFLCRVCSPLLHSAAEIPSRQRKDQNSVSALIFTGLTSVWIIALLSAPLLLICISIREIRALPSVFKAS